ncbi:MAG: DUF3857 and transglutaminase domain-containing protein [Bacteroidales bacterium]|nr:DUF3857 and transglutaminase domain-containing protein [Bacteroidales bacterium]
MKTRLLIVLLFILCAYITDAGELEYSFSDIPEELVENADAVIRIAEGRLEVLSAGKAVFKSRNVVTILNKNADSRSVFVTYYNKSDKISFLAGKVYNAAGKCISTIHSNDFDDMSAVSGYSLYDDTRMKVYRAFSAEYPYTVEYECEKTIEGLLFYPDCYFIPGYRVSVQNSKYSVDVPEKLGLRYKNVNIDMTPETMDIKQGIRYIWECSNLAAIEEEPYSLPVTSLVPHILIGANEFEIEGYSGYMDSWKNLGRWNYNLLKGSDELPEHTILKMRDLVKHCSNDIEKVKEIYSYVQKKTRYVSISLGIGGWKPFPAKVVDEVGYGDCKALSNYTVSLLKAVGIKSYYTAIIAGRNETDMVIDFPSQQTNHIIVCVPLENDTIWLECTDQFCPFGYLSTSTDDRYAHLINEDGGKIVKTPAYPKDSNLFIHKSRIHILPDGNAFANQQLIFRSLYYDEVDDFLIEGADQQKRWLYDNVEIPDFIIRSYSYQQGGDRYPFAVITQEIDLPNYCTRTSDRIFIPLKMMDREIYVPRKLKERKRDIYFKRGYIRVDTINYVIPDGFRIEFIPDEYKTESVFGKYYAKVLQEGKEIFYIRRSENNPGIFPENEYDNMVEYYKQIAKADKVQLVLIKNESE